MIEIINSNINVALMYMQQFPKSILWHLKIESNKPLNLFYSPPYLVTSLFWHVYLLSRIIVSFININLSFALY